MDLELQGKLAIVTGGSRGIGKAVARELAKEGATVAIVARDLGTAKIAASEIAAETGQSLYAYRADTGKDDDVRAAVSQICAEHERIDILVNCAAQPAGQQAAPKLANITDAIFWADVNVKVLGYLRFAREVAPGDAASALWPHYQYFRIGCTPDRIDYRIDPQCQRGGSDKEPGG